MKALTPTLTLFLILISTVTFAQKKVSGIIYKDGKPAAGIMVESQRSRDSYYTSFDGKYELTLHPKDKWMRFTWGDDSKKLNLTGEEGDIINFSFDGSPIPESNGEPGVINKTLEQLQKDRDTEFLNAYSLYLEYFKAEDYKSGRPHWEKVYKQYPKATARIYQDGLKMYENYFEKTINPAHKMAYLDTMMTIFDKRIKHLGNASDLLGRKAARYLEGVLTIDLAETEKIKGIKKGYGYAQDAIKEAGIETLPAVIVLWMQSSRTLFTSNQMGKSEVLENYESAMSLLEQQLAKPEMKNGAEQAIPLIQQIIEGSGALDCSSMADLYGTKFKNNPNDIEMIKKMLAMMRRENCTDNELFVKGSEKLYQLQPSAESAINMARMFVRMKEFEKALNYYKEAYEKETDTDAKAAAYFETAVLALQQEKISQARDLAREAIKLKPDYCEALIFMGEIYTQASRAFNGDAFEKSTVFWVAVDYYERAMRIPSCKSDAESKIKFLNSYFPNVEEIFFRELSVGQRYTVGGWINETTSVRARQ